MANSVDLSVIRIYSKIDRVIGTAFMIDEGRILTCAHVIQDALGIKDKQKTDIPTDKIKVDFPLSKQKESCSAQVLAWDVESDIAVLKFTSSLPKDALQARLLVLEKLEGVRFSTFGFPVNYDDGIWSIGVIRGKNAKGWFQLEDEKTQGYQIKPGFSGAPVWNEEKNWVVGMVVAADTDPQAKAAFCIPADALIEMVQKSGGVFQVKNPYRGLEAFQAEHAQYFFGRTKMINALAEKVAQQNFVAVVGPSGSGKSSLIRAGLLPKLKNEAGYSDVVITPTKNPIDRLILGLLDWQDITSLADKLNEARKIADLIQQDPATLQRFFMQAQRDGQVKRVLVIDQFEELFTQVTEEKTRRVFIDTLITIAQDDFAKVVIAIRADFYGSLLADPVLGLMVNESQYNVLPLSRDDVREVIEQPALLLGRRFDPGLVEIILQETLGQPGYLPLLEFALTQLWDKQTASGTLTVQAYDEIGRVAGAMAKAAEQVVRKYEQLDKTNLVRQVFVRLVQPGMNAPDTRRRATKDEFSQHENAELWQVVKDLADARLVVTGFDTTTDDETVEVSHEALIKGWARLGKWVDGDREFLTWRQSQLDQELRKWELAGRDDGALLRGEALVIAKRWLRERMSDIGEDENKYIFYSILDEGIDFEIWIPRFVPFTKIFSYLDEYFISEKEEKRLTAINTLQWLVSQNQDDATKIYEQLEFYILNDPSQKIQDKAAFAICKRQQIDSLVGKLQNSSSQEVKKRIITALAYVRNLPKFGKKIDQYKILPKNIIKRESILQLTLAYRNEFAVFLLIIFLIGQLSQLVISPFVNLIIGLFGKILSPSFSGSLGGIGSIDLGVVDIVFFTGIFLYSYIRRVMINEEVFDVGSRFRVGVFSYIATNGISLCITPFWFLLYPNDFSSQIFSVVIGFIGGLIYQTTISVLMPLDIKDGKIIRSILKISMLGFSLAFFIPSNILILIQAGLHGLSGNLVELIGFLIWVFFTGFPTFITTSLCMIGLYFGFQLAFQNRQISQEKPLEDFFQNGQLKLSNYQLPKPSRTTVLITLFSLFLVTTVTTNLNNIVKVSAPIWCSLTTSNNESSGLIIKFDVTVHRGPDSSTVNAQNAGFGTCVKAFGRYKWDNNLISIRYGTDQGWVEESDVFWFKELNLPEFDPDEH